MKKIIIAAISLFVIAGCNTSKEQKWDTTVVPSINGLQIPAGFYLTELTGVVLGLF